MRKTSVLAGVLTIGLIATGCGGKRNETPAAQGNSGGPQVPWQEQARSGDGRGGEKASSSDRLHAAGDEWGMGARIVDAGSRLVKRGRLTTRPRRLYPRSQWSRLDVAGGEGGVGRST